MQIDVTTCVAQYGATKREEPVATIDMRALTPLTTTRRCPFCRASNLRRFVILRVCVACANVFHWRDALSAS